MSPASIILAAALVAAPGAALALVVLPPGRTTLAAAIGLIVPLGVAWVAAAGLILALAHALTLTSFVVLYLPGTAAAWVLVLRRGDLMERFAAWREDLRGERWTAAGGLVVLVALAATRLTYSPVLNLADQTPLRYWADGLEIAGAHRIPALSLQWGRLFPATVSKVVLNAFSAAGSLVLGRGPLGPLGALLVVASIGVLLVTYALARELGLRQTAPLVVIALFANHVLGPRSLTDDLVNYRAETWGRLLVLAALVLAVRTFRSHRRAEGLAAGVMFGLAAGTHLVPVVVGAAFLGAYAVAAAAFERQVKPTLRTAGAIAVVGVALGAVVLLVPRGDVGFQAAGDTSVYPKLATELGLPPTFDPTRYLALGELEPPPPRGTFYEPPSSVYHEYVRRVVGEERLRRPFLVVLPVAGIAAVAALLRWGSSRMRALALASALTAAGILVVALAFDYRFDIYVLAEFGPRRLFDYTAIPAVLLVAGVLELALGRLGSRTPAFAMAGVLLVAAFAVPRNVSSSGRERFFASALPPLAWIEANVPCGGRVLADRRTLATLESLTRHAGVTEGMGPYLRPSVLTTAIRSLLDARRFFLDPGADPGYLRREGVAAVVVTSYDQTLGGVGGPLKAAPHPDLNGVPSLQLALSTATVRVYRVVDFDPATARRFPDVRSLPGYECGAG